MANTLLLKTFDGGTNYASANADTTVYTVPSAKTTIVIGIMVSNITTKTIVIGVKIQDTASPSVTVNYMKNIAIPSGSSLEIMSGNKLILNTTDLIKVTSDTANSFDITLSIVEQDT